MKTVVLVAAWSMVMLAMGLAHAQAPLPVVSDVAVPGGGVVHIALPPASCGYPKEIRDRAEKFLSGGEHGLQLLRAAGDCASIERLSRGESGLILHSFQLEMLKDEIDPVKRSTAAAYRRECFEQYPKRKENTSSDALRLSLREADSQMNLGEAMSLGLLSATRDAVFGGTLTEAARTPRRLILVQVTACFAPGDVPLLWIFQDAVDRGANDGDFAQALRDLLALAQSQVKMTMELNRAATPHP